MDTLQNMMKKVIQPICMILVICAMIGIAEITGQKEIIFPEIAAICTGAFLAPAFPWKTDLLRILITVSVCAVLGVLIVQFLPFSLFAQMMIAFALSQAVIMLSGTNFVPMVSAVVLPVLMQSRGPVYPAAAFILTLIICLIVMALEKADIRDKIEFTGLRSLNGEALRISIMRIAAACIVIFAATSSGMSFIAAPPLLAAFTEISDPDSRPGKKPVRVVLVVSLCALAGSVCRYLITEKAGLPLIAAGLAACICIIIIFKVSDMYFPPAGALAILPMLIDSGKVIIFPAQIFAGIFIIVILGRIIAKISGRGGKRDEKNDPEINIG